LAFKKAIVTFANRVDTMKQVPIFYNCNSRAWRTLLNRTYGQWLPCSMTLSAASLKQLCFCFYFGGGSTAPCASPPPRPSIFPIIIFLSTAMLTGMTHAAASDRFCLFQSWENEQSSTAKNLFLKGAVFRPSWNYCPRTRTWRTCTCRTRCPLLTNLRCGRKNLILEL
jgi:hypothetical protein